VVGKRRERSPSACKEKKKEKITTGTHLLRGKGDEKTHEKRTQGSTQA